MCIWKQARLSPVWPGRVFWESMDNIGKQSHETRKLNQCEKTPLVYWDKIKLAEYIM